MRADVRHWASQLISGNCDNYQEMCLRKFIKDALKCGSPSKMQIVLRVKGEEHILWKGKK